MNGVGMLSLQCRAAHAAALCRIVPLKYGPLPWHQHKATLSPMFSSNSATDGFHDRNGVWDMIDRIWGVPPTAHIGSVPRFPVTAPPTSDQQVAAPNSEKSSHLDVNFDEKVFRQACQKYGVNDIVINKCVHYLTTRDSTVWDDPPTDADAYGKGAVGIPQVDVPQANTIAISKEHTPVQDNNVLKPFEAVNVLMTEVISKEHWEICGFGVEYKRDKKTSTIHKDEEESVEGFLARVLDEIQDTSTVVPCALRLTNKDGKVKAMTLYFEAKQYTPNMLQNDYSVEFLDAIDVDQLNRVIKVQL